MKRERFFIYAKDEESGKMDFVLRSEQKTNLLKYAKEFYREKNYREENEDGQSFFFGDPYRCAEVFLDILVKEDTKIVINVREGVANGASKHLHEVVKAMKSAQDELQTGKKKQTGSQVAKQQKKAKKSVPTGASSLVERPLSYKELEGPLVERDGNGKLKIIPGRVRDFINLTRRYINEHWNDFLKGATSNKNANVPFTVDVNTRNFGINKDLEKFIIEASYLSFTLVDDLSISNFYASGGEDIIVQVMNPIVKKYLEEKPFFKINDQGELQIILGKQPELLAYAKSFYLKAIDPEGLSLRGNVAISDDAFCMSPWDLYKMDIIDLRACVNLFLIDLIEEDTGLDLQIGNLPNSCDQFVELVLKEAIVLDEAVKQAKEERLQQARQQLIESGTFIKLDAAENFTVIKGKEAALIELTKVFIEARWPGYLEGKEPEQLSSEERTPISDLRDFIIDKALHDCGVEAENGRELAFNKGNGLNLMAEVLRPIIKKHKAAAEEAAAKKAAAEKAAAEEAAAKKAAAEKAAAEKAAAERAAAEKAAAEAEKLIRDKVKTQIAAERAVAEAEKRIRDKISTQKVEAEKAAAEGANRLKNAFAAQVEKEELFIIQNFLSNAAVSCSREVPVVDGKRVKAAAGNGHDRQSSYCCAIG
jgi:hypothetical protein